MTTGRFGSLADTQRPEECRIADFGAEEASANVRFRPIADISRRHTLWPCTNVAEPQLSGYPLRDNQHVQGLAKPHSPNNSEIPP